MEKSQEYRDPVTFDLLIQSWYHIYKSANAEARADTERENSTDEEWTGIPAPAVKQWHYHSPTIKSASAKEA